MIPEVTVWPRPNGLPIARTKSPTCRRSESPIGTAVRLLPEICSTAISVSGSRPINLALKRRLSLVVTSMLFAIFATWAVGQHIALRGIDDDSRARRLGLALDRLLLHVEKPPEHRVLQQRIVLAHSPAHRDADNTRGYPAHDRGDAVHRSAAHFRYRRPGEHQTRVAHHQSDPA